MSDSGARMPGRARSRLKGLAIAAVLCACLAAAGCGGSSSGSSDSAAKVGNAGGPGPEVELPPGAPPKKLVVKDLRKGSGTEAKVGYKVTIRYVGVRWTGQVYSNSWAYGTPPSFLLGAHELTMPGFDDGIRGMRVGGRRELIIPPSARFESGPRRQRTSPGETLVYVVDLLKAVPNLRGLRTLTAGEG